MSSNKSAREELERIYTSKRDDNGKLHYYKDITGQKYGRLTAIKYVYTKNKKAYWLCKCDCGNEVIIAYSSLKSKNTKSCGCLKHEYAKKYYSNLNKTHGMTETNLYKKWLGIKTRCYNKGVHGYKNYGGRGIKVCDEWLHSFENFYDWAIYHGYSDGLTLERIDTNGNYEPDNCKWITNLEQQNNKRNNRYIQYGAEKHTIAEWSRLTGINKNTLRDRLNNNWNIEEILEIKQHKKRGIISVKK